MPSGPFWQSRWHPAVLLVGVLLGALVGALLVFLLEWLESGVIRSPEDAERALGVAREEQPLHGDEVRVVPGDERHDSLVDVEQEMSPLP